MAALYLEAERFSEPGGWVIDTQCVESMGSPYLMAHGMGLPVPDARITLELPESGTWHIFARTRDWTAVWKRGKPAGRFQIGVNSRLLDEVLGANGSKWAWQKAGAIELSRGKIQVSLHDLTGFNGRCAALYFTTNLNDLPPDDKEALLEFKNRRFPVKIEEDPVQYDLLVCGGGYAGICTALAARETRQNFLLIHDRGILGGCNSSEVRVWLGGLTNLGKYPELGHISAAIGPITGLPPNEKTREMFEDARKEHLFCKGQNLLLHEMLESVEFDPQNKRKIAAVITRNLRSGKKTRRRAALFADCTGDATLARSCGCETMYGRESSAQFHESLAPEKADRQVMGHSVLWETKKLDHPAVFPDIDWGIEFNDSNAIHRFTSCWDWECGQYRDQVKDIEFIRDYGLMTVMCNWSFLKNHASDNAEWNNYELEWISPIGGKRESYRVCGDYILTQNDIEQKRPHPDATAAISWSIDMHFPDPENEKQFGEGFLSCAYHRGIEAPYEVPYRCLYAKDMDNLFLGGRIISASHVAFSCIRVMRTLGMLGEVAGMASAICKKHNCPPREVYTAYLEELCEMMKNGLKLWQVHGYWPDASESYHFMRPANSVGNSTEDVWIRFQPEAARTNDIPGSIRKCIDALEIKQLPS